MRVAVRRSVIDGLHKTFDRVKNSQKPPSYQPYQLLMLGGDDLLLVCQAKYAFDFLVNYAQSLAQIPLIDGKLLSIGAGVVITSPRIPFHHLHHLAEELMKSAKHLFRDCEENISVVDWIISTNAWTDKPIISRQREMRVSYEVDGQRETLALTGRPYPILQTAEKESLNSLQSLSQAAKYLTDATEESQAARSQLRQLVYELAQGRRWADLCLQGLPKETLEVLSTLACLREDSCWQSIDTQTWQTVLADLIELYEIPNLQRQDKNEPANTV
ncbi:hypothetical protein BGP_0438 [Beggiatoa sp. PS]|nr:hypothetical protein BGP_0438 [Beggiatoa sp. PS]